MNALKRTHSEEMMPHESMESIEAAYESPNGAFVNNYHDFSNMDPLMLAEESNFDDHESLQMRELSYDDINSNDQSSQYFRIPDLEKRSLQNNSSEDAIAGRARSGVG